jgi:geranylgeranyl pyrophosphate synthase
MSAVGPLVADQINSWTLPQELDTQLGQLMARTVSSLAGPLATPLLRVVNAGGKRLRPALTFAMARRIGSQGEFSAAADVRALHLAAAVELLHCATLVHDDLIDCASSRRGIVTVNAHEGDDAAIVGGDLLIAASMLLAAQVSDRSAIVIAQTLAALCHGEALQARARYDATTSIEALLEIARLKTGSLLQAACVLGAEAVRAPASMCAAVADFGVNFGVCLQLIDDLLDITSTSELSGKPVGADFGSGTLTVPAALAMIDTDGLGDLFRPGLDAVSRRRAVTVLQHSRPALSATLALAEGHATAARVSLSALPGGPGEIASWPRAFIDKQITTKVDYPHRWLVAQSATLA